MNNILTGLHQILHYWRFLQKCWSDEHMETYLKTVRNFLLPYISYEQTYSPILRRMVYFFQLQGDPFFPIITSSGGTVEERFKLSTSNSWMNRSRRRLIIVTSSVATSLATNLLRTSSRILSDKTWDPTLWTTYKNPLTICTFLRRRWMTEWWMQRVAWCLPRPGSISLIFWQRRWTFRAFLLLNNIRALVTISFLANIGVGMEKNVPLLERYSLWWR